MLQKTIKNNKKMIKKEYYIMQNNEFVKIKRKLLHVEKFVLK